MMKSSKEQSGSGDVVKLQTECLLFINIQRKKWLKQTKIGLSFNEALKDDKVDKILIYFMFYYDYEMFMKNKTI